MRARGTTRWDEEIMRLSMRFKAKGYLGMGKYVIPTARYAFTLERFLFVCWQGLGAATRSCRRSGASCKQQTL